MKSLWQRKSYILYLLHDLNMFSALKLKNIAPLLWATYQGRQADNSK